MSLDSAPRKPLHPYWVLIAAIILPGMGQLLNAQITRALTFIFFVVLFGAVTYHLTTPAHSFVGRHAGGLFIYAIAVMDAYRFARLRQAVYAESTRAKPTSTTSKVTANDEV